MKISLAERDMISVACGRRVQVDEVRRGVDRTVREEGMATHLVIISDREPLAWVLRTQRMAFPAGRASTGLPAKGDQALLYTTRGCYRNTTRDRGRVMGLAVVTSPVKTLPKSVVFGERWFTSGCALRVEGLAPVRDGVVLADLVPRLEVFPDERSWSVRMRRASLSLPPADAELLTRELRPLLAPRLERLADYTRGTEWHDGT
ncbi:hypothetical protein [Streptomyces noursei]|uniref:hypothetical protein n=1 Tax=Streptomyces noursei TaxID=1971 RepID=UPI001F1666AD|nr:hypothetical protein [Streptomyces noursei]